MRYAYGNRDVSASDLAECVAGRAVSEGRRKSPVLLTRNPPLAELYSAPHPSRPAPTNKSSKMCMREACPHGHLGRGGHSPQGTLAAAIGEGFMASMSNLCQASPRLRVECIRTRYVLFTSLQTGAPSTPRAACPMRAAVLCRIPKSATQFRRREDSGSDGALGTSGNPSWVGSGSRWHAVESALDEQTWRV